ncbi:MAG TPA: glutamate carboxypeptidase, partial [Terriglobales bacterium]|nr:glutamate carboxypeptidase [Terriglobales bacterium]
MRRVHTSVLIFLFLLAQAASTQQQTLAAPQLPGFRNATDELLLEQRFLKVPQPYLAEQHLKVLTAVPHMAGTPEDRK